MYADKLSFNIDWKRKTIHVYQENDETQQIVVDEEGSGVLSIGLFKVINIGSLKSFIKKIQETLTKEQMRSVFFLWGHSSAIKLGGMVDILGDRLLAKEVIKIGIQKGILVTGVNSTYRIVNKEEQKTLKDYADRMKEGNTREGIAVSMQRTENTELEGEEDSVVIATKDGIISENIANGKITTRSVEELQKELNELQARLENNKDWNEDETPHTVIDQMNKIKAQLRLLTPQGGPFRPSHSDTKALPVKKPVSTKQSARKPKP